MSKERKDKRMLWGLLLLLAMVAGLWGYCGFQNRMYARELALVADEKLLSLAPEESRGELDIAGPVIHVAREYLIFGKAQAKISYYFRTQGLGGGSGSKVEEDPHGHGLITGVEYHLDRVEEDWVLRDSSHCGSEQCQVQGAQAFMDSPIPANID